MYSVCCPLLDNYPLSLTFNLHKKASTTTTPIKHLNALVDATNPEETCAAAGAATGGASAGASAGGESAGASTGGAFPGASAGGALAGASAGGTFAGALAGGASTSAGSNTSVYDTA